ncbi:MAG: hypothetical protein ACYDBV_15050 [Nitrospiria bacterium]
MEFKGKGFIRIEPLKMVDGKEVRGDEMFLDPNCVGAIWGNGKRQTQIYTNFGIFVFWENATDFYTRLSRHRGFDLEDKECWE